MIHRDANDIFRQAECSSEKAHWVAGVNDIIYMVCSATLVILAGADMPKFSTLVAVFTLDRLGRRKTLFWGSCIMGVSMFLSGELSRPAINNSDRGAQYGAAAATFTFIFTAGFSATWLTVPWLCPAEIFPLQAEPRVMHGVLSVGALEIDGLSVFEKLITTLRKESTLRFSPRFFYAP